MLVNIRTTEFVPGSRDKNICVYRDNISGVELFTSVSVKWEIHFVIISYHADLLWSTYKPYTSKF